MRVRDVMSHPVITVAPTTEAAIAARVLYSHGFTALPVVDDGRLVGIVTEADLITAPPEDGAHRWRRGSATGPLRVGEVMTSPVESLTAKELAVFMKLALGRSVGEVAEDFCLSASTVGTHLYHIKQKLQVNNAAELTLVALRNGLIEG